MMITASTTLMRRSSEGTRGVSTYAPLFTTIDDSVTTGKGQGEAGAINFEIIIIGW